jgi:hypothetical protein
MVPISVQPPGLSLAAPLAAPVLPVAASPVTPSLATLQAQHPPAVPPFEQSHRPLSWHGVDPLVTLALAPLVTLALPQAAPGLPVAVPLASCVALPHLPVVRPPQPTTSIGTHAAKRNAPRTGRLFPQSNTGTLQSTSRKGPEPAHLSP